MCVPKIIISTTTQLLTVNYSLRVYDNAHFRLEIDISKMRKPVSDEPGLVFVFSRTKAMHTR